MHRELLPIGGTQHGMRQVRKEGQEEGQEEGSEKEEVTPGISEP
jgi:hypothetical protein